MTDETSVIELEIQNQKGLHARAAASFVKAIEDFDAEITVERLGQSVCGTSIMGLMMLAASKGSVIKISARGKQSKEALETLTKLINSKFGEQA